MPRERASGDGKGRRRRIRIGIAGRLRVHYKEAISAYLRFYRIRQFHEHRETKQWVSALGQLTHSQEMMRYAIRALEQEHEFCKQYIELFRKYPEFLKLPGHIIERIGLAAREMTRINDYLQRTIESHAKYKTIWAKESAKLIKRVEKNQHYAKLKVELEKRRAEAVKKEKDFDEFAQRLFSETQTSVEAKLKFLAKAEKTVAEAKVMQEEQEIEMARFYHGVTQRFTKAPQHFLDELARQIYVHQALWRLYSRKAGAE
ncbi:MAG: hypothetical protein PHD95_02055 [Candidatus ainarchaeum sp.]|nr:hypothetical protein [Candidatus ainarchaeum sp.]